MNGKSSLAFRPATQRPWQSGRMLLIALLSAGLSSAWAAQTPYRFTTTGAPYGNAPAAAFDPQARVNGQFLFDAATAATGTASNGGTLYSGSFTGLSGSVQGLGFADSIGYSAVGNDLPAFGNNDWFQFGANASGVGAQDLTGFALSGYKLVNVRLFWIEGQPGIPDFISGGQALLAAPPSMQGRLALDFVPASATTGPLSWVFFDGLTVTAVPEPASAWLLALGIAGVAGWLRGRSKVE